MADINKLFICQKRVVRIMFGLCNENYSKLVICYEQKLEVISQKSSVKSQNNK